MDGEAIGVVLARASELRSKISHCIVRSGRPVDSLDGRAPAHAEDDGEEEEEVKAECLFDIRDALHSLERQLAALQDLQQQQRYERESILAQIDRSRMVLLGKLKEYKGEELEMVHEALAFAGEIIEHDDGLILPPYRSHLPELLALDDLHPTSYFRAAKYKFRQNGTISNSKHEGNRTGDGSQSRKPSRGIRHFFGFIAKSVVTFVGIVSILSIAGYQPNLKLPDRFQHLNKIMQLLDRRRAGQRVPKEEEPVRVLQCPPGKVLVIEDGRARCLAKERIEVPFESDVISPNIKYGFG